MIEEEPDGMVDYIIYFWKTQFKSLYSYFFKKTVCHKKLS